MPVRKASRHLLRTFVTGALAALPLVATALLLVWSARLLITYLGPESFFGQMLIGLGLDVAGSEAVGYLLGVGIVLGAIFLLGVVVQTRLKHAFTRFIDLTVQRIPLVGNVYELIRKFVEMLSKREDGSARSMRPVWLQFGGPGHAAVLGLLSTPEPVLVNGEPYLAVIVPTAPVPVGGGLLFVPEAWVTPAEVGMDGLTSIYVSMGVTAGQHLPPVPR